MKDLICINLQSFSDLITNSSSELFQLRTDNTVEQVSEILSSLTRGYFEPILFDLVDYHKHRNTFQKLCDDIRPSSDDNKEWSEYWCATKNLKIQYPKYYLYDTLTNWFYDIENENDWYYIRFMYLTRDFTPIRTKFYKYLLNNNGFVKGTQLHYYNVKKEVALQFMETHKFPADDIFKKLRDFKDIRKLNGCILLLSKDDNTIPCNSFEKINKLFNGTNYHLG